MPAPTVAYVSGQKLHVKAPGLEARAIDSKFAETVRDRAAQVRRRHSWKHGGRGAQFQGALLWGMDGDELGGGAGAVVTGLSRGRKAGEVLYTLSTGTVSGLFAVDVTRGDPAESEQRLFHSADLRPTQPSGGEVAGFVACGLPTATGASNLAVMLDDGSDLTELTAGDSVDTAPSWVPGKDRQLVYQTAGVGRDASGQALGFGPYAIHRYDIPGQNVSPLLEDPAHDLLGPKVDGRGRLHCIRRPHQSPGRSGSLWRALLDFLLFPFRLLAAVFGFLNFFTTRYTGKPLTTAGGPSRRRADARQMMIWGNLIDAGQAAEDAAQEHDAPASMVPRSWQLVRYEPSRELEVVAKGVVAFDLVDDGSIVYSNGNAVFHLRANGTRELLAKGAGITHLVAVRAARGPGLEPEPVPA